MASSARDKLLSVGFTGVWLVVIIGAIALVNVVFWGALVWLVVWILQTMGVL